MLVLLLLSSNHFKNATFFIYLILKISSGRKNIYKTITCFIIQHYPKVLDCYLVVNEQLFFKIKIQKLKFCKTVSTIIYELIKKSSFFLIRFNTVFLVKLKGENGSAIFAPNPKNQKKRHLRCRPNPQKTSPPNQQFSTILFHYHPNSFLSFIYTQTF